MNAMYETPAIRKILKTAYAEDVFVPFGSASYLSHCIERSRRIIEEEEGALSERIRPGKRAEGEDGSIS